MELLRQKKYPKFRTSIFLHSLLSDTYAYDALDDSSVYDAPAFGGGAPPRPRSSRFVSLFFFSRSARSRSPCSG